MIISHRHRYIYIEVPRTGSTAIAAELIENYDGHDILRKHATYRDFLRLANANEKTYFPFQGVRNPLDIAVTRYVRLKDDIDELFSNSREVAERNALPGVMERRVHAWVERHDASFEQFLKRYYKVTWDSWASLDRRRMKSVMRFEELQSEFARTLRQIGIEPVRELPYRNVTPVKNRDWKSYYTPAAIRRATWVFGPYMAEWGYSFPEEWGDIKVPAWSRAELRIARFFRGIYWKYLRYSDYVKRRPGGLVAIPRDPS